MVFLYPATQLICLFEPPLMIFFFLSESIFFPFMDLFDFEILCSLCSCLVVGNVRNAEKGMGGREGGRETDLDDLWV